MKLVAPITPIPPYPLDYRFEPGNGTSYDLLFGRIPGGKVLLTWLYNGGSGGGVFRFDPDNFLHHSYLSEKLPLPYCSSSCRALALKSDCQARRRTTPSTHRPTPQTDHWRQPMTTRLTGDEERSLTLTLMEMVTVRVALAASRISLPDRAHRIDGILGKINNAMLEIENDKGDATNG